MTRERKNIYFNAKMSEIYTIISTKIHQSKCPEHNP